MVNEPIDGSNKLRLLVQIKCWITQTVAVLPQIHIWMLGWKHGLRLLTLTGDFCTRKYADVVYFNHRLGEFSISFRPGMSGNVVVAWCSMVQLRHGYLIS